MSATTLPRLVRNIVPSGTSVAASSTSSTVNKNHDTPPPLISIGGSISGSTNSDDTDPLESDYNSDTEQQNNDSNESDDNNDDEDDDDDDDDDDADGDDNDRNNDDNDDEKENNPNGRNIRKENGHDDNNDIIGKCNNLIISRSDRNGVFRDYHLDDFQIIKTIGTGTFGRVCLCKDKKTSSYCAMKILAMSDVIRLKQVEHVKNEKNILTEIIHPFVVNLRWSTKDDCCLYMLFEYVCGGELFSYLRNSGKFNSQTANFYTSEIVLALEYLHSLSIVYRDLKPENLLINRDGHMKITDFGFAKKLKDRTWTLCGTPEYLAPEIIQSKGHNRAVDWWALGVLIYEMLVGYPPFYDDNPFGIYEKILSGKIEWPRHMDPIAKDLVKKLLVLDRTKRLGNMKNGAADVKRHRWFKHLNWNDVYNKKLTPPLIPKVSFEGDSSNFDEYPETEWKPARSLDKADMQLFEDF